VEKCVSFRGQEVKELLLSDAHGGAQGEIFLYIGQEEVRLVSP